MSYSRGLALVVKARTQVTMREETPRSEPRTRMRAWVLGTVIALIALGLSVIFGLLDIINIAHGDFFMVGTVIAWFTLEATGNFWLGFIAAPLIGFILGALIQRVVIQPV